jgi:GH43 family beta-xylosidase
LAGKKENFGSAGLYSNPVYPDNFPDPFVLKHRGEYYAYCTGIRPDGNVFGVLHSRDLTNWREIGGAMPPLERDAPFYWAPEVTYSNGKFYLYYSVGNETLMEIRVAVSDRPDGGFIDTGKRLTDEEFAIDAHIFTDEDGSLYFFYATDFLEHTHIGTGTVVDRMPDLLTPAGDARPVTRAKYDWQVYDPQRAEKGGVRWHTVEGPFVLKRKGVYYQMFSAGNWKNPTYGVSFAVTGDIGQTDEWRQFADGRNVLPILRTIDGKVTGPGHNSVVRGINNRELFCVYHRWAERGRVLAVDRMDFAGGARMFVRGATVTPQAAPLKPRLLDFFEEFSEADWETVSGRWQTENGEMVSGASPAEELDCRKRAESFLLETSLRLKEDGTGGRFGIILKDHKIEILRFFLEPENKRACLDWLENGERKTEGIPLPAGFDFRAVHLLRIESDYFTVKISLDGQPVLFRRDLPKVPLRFALAAENCRAAFSGTALTAGFENLFEADDLNYRGWRQVHGAGEYRIADKNLIVSNRRAEKTVFRKGVPKKNYEMAANFRLVETFGEDFRFGFYPAFSEIRETPFVSFGKADGKWTLKTVGGTERKEFKLPPDFSPEQFQQISFRKHSDRIVVGLETETLGEFAVPERNAKIAFAVQNAEVAFDMIRVTGFAG